MNSPKNKAQQQRIKVKNLSAVLAIGLAVITLFQAGNVKSEKATREISNMEAELLAEAEDWFQLKEMDLEEKFVDEAIANTDYFKVFDMNGSLIMEGNPSQNEVLRKLVNQAEFMSQFSGQQYYTLTK